MTATAAAQFRTVSFGDPEGRVWCGALAAGARPAIIFGAAGATGAAAGPDGVRWSEQDGGWTLSGASFELLCTPVPEAGAAPMPEAGAPSAPSHPRVSLDELCRVRGTLTAGDTEHTVDCIGTRSLSQEIDPARLGSVRGVSGWFGDHDALTLVAFRPAGSARHEDDVVVATVFEPDRRLEVQEPRLSTTYDEAGTPARTSLELWIDDGEQQFPRRAAAEALGAGTQARGPGIQLQATPLRCHARGLEGAGVYLLARL